MRAWPRQHPFLLAFLLLAVWSLSISMFSYTANQRRLDDLDQLRQADAGLAARTTFQLCVGQNEILQQIRSAVLDNDMTRKRLHVADTEPVTLTVVQQAALGGPNSKYAQALLAFLDRFANHRCHQLPTQTATTTTTS